MWAGGSTRRSRAPRLLLVASVLAGGGCADDFSWPWDRPAPWQTSGARSGSGQWENPSKPFEAWNVDRAECRQLATERAEQEFAAAQGGGPPVTWSRTAPFEQSMTRFEAEQRRDDLFARCMIDRGYRLVPRVESQ